MMAKIQKINDNKIGVKYIEAVGRRKTSVARTRILEVGEKLILVNGKAHYTYFPSLALKQTAEQPLKETGLLGKIRIEAKVSGGGIASQAGALRHGIARAVVKYQSELRKPLKRLGFLTRDARAKERRKFGLKKARKAPQWSKR